MKVMGRGVMWKCRVKILGGGVGEGDGQRCCADRQGEDIGLEYDGQRRCADLEGKGIGGRCWVKVMGRGVVWICMG